MADFPFQTAGSLEPRLCDMSEAGVFYNRSESIYSMEITNNQEVRLFPLAVQAPEPRTEECVLIEDCGHFTNQDTFFNAYVFKYVFSSGIRYDDY